ncbi:oral cancer-overexpressed protein 1 homolog [Plakobranchus ocellatus]|uniref:Oral cancer-overexpressed protein 1 homolog n=1 Tax=Plakobranchus ocellatus TaxID=259542 RepID=A0AAV3Z8E7_9GAST|nr:oral cancer-overexpressed protein 1 homolog [Plakobranchus ocellatus]
MAASRECQDDDLFHSVTMTEEISWNQGYSEGLELNREKATEEGYNLGASKGLEIGMEVGFYAGYATQVMTIFRNETSKSRILKVCEAIITLANNFSDVDPMDEALTDNLRTIQGKFKQLTSLLGVQTDYVKESSNNSKGSSF